MYGIYKLENKVFFGFLAAFILISAGTIAPTINGSNVSNIIERESINSFDDNDFQFLGKSFDFNSNSSIRDVLSLFENRDIDDNFNRIGNPMQKFLSSFLNSFFEEDFLNCPSEEFLNFVKYLNTSMNENNFKQFFKNRFLQLYSEISLVINGKKSINELSPLLQNILKYFDSNPKQKVNSFGSLKIEGMIETYDQYEERYDDLNDYWHSRSPEYKNTLRGIFLFNILGYDESNYYEWSKERDSRDDGIVWASALLIAFGIAVIVLAPDWYVDAIGCLILLAVLFYDVVLLIYIINTYEIFDIIQSSEPDILVHVVNETSVDITGLEGEFIRAQNDNAVNRCEEEGNNESWSKNYFRYSLGPSEYMKEKTGEEGWYSLNEREFVHNIYEKAPCPPGDWTITIGGNSDWDINETTIQNIEGNEVYIIDPYILERNEDEV